MHLEDDFECQTAPVTLAAGENRRTFLFACRYFALERLDLGEAATLRPEGERFYVLSCIEGNCHVSGGGQEVLLRPGLTCLVPAEVDEVVLGPEGRAALLKAYVPDLGRDVVEPLRAAGVSDDAIVGGRPHATQRPGAHHRGIAPNHAGARGCLNRGTPVSDRHDALAPPDTNTGDLRSTCRGDGRSPYGRAASWRHTCLEPS